VSALTPASLAVDLSQISFAEPASSAAGGRKLGVEVEFIPVEALTGRRCPIESDSAPSTLPLLRSFGARQGWLEGRTSKGTPCFIVPQGGTISYEPGGQLEYASPPCLTASSLLSLVRSVVLPLRAAAMAEGIDLLSTGIDPFNAVDRAPLLLRARRYELMAEYFARVGKAGAQMMRQTASFQLNLDFDDQPWLRWKVSNAMAPYVTAIFANSPIYRAAPTGYQSTRAAVWQAVDPSRTGLPFDEKDPIRAYLNFALRAPAMLLPTVSGVHRSFAEWLRLATLSREEWHEHLSCLFPEVRPRGHLELRSADAVSPDWYAAPVALSAGILYDRTALDRAAELLGPPDPELLVRAARLGLHDTLIQEVAVDLFEIALAGCRALGPRYFHPADLEQAENFFDQYTCRGRAPADDVLEDAVAA
jgi:glutamate--cysteine ligase